MEQLELGCIPAKKKKKNTADNFPYLGLNSAIRSIRTVPSSVLEPHW